MTLTYKPITEKFDCGYPIDDVTKLTWSGLQEDMPKAYEFLENFQITNNPQTVMVITETDEIKTDEEAARVWKDANEDMWKRGFHRWLVDGRFRP